MYIEPEPSGHRTSVTEGMGKGTGRTLELVHYRLEYRLLTYPSPGSPGLDLDLTLNQPLHVIIEKIIDLTHYFQ